MLKLYNKEHEAVSALTNLKDYKIEYLLSGEDLLEFSLSIYDENINLTEEEGYVRNKYNEYVIKAIDPSQNFKRFSCIVNIENIKAKAIKNFDTSNNTITEAIRLAIAGTGWILADNNISKRRTVRVKNTDALGVLREIRNVFRVDYRFDAINKVIYVYEHFGSDKGVYFSDELNLKTLTVPSDTYDYATRLYCYGKEGLNIASVNGGKEYIENFQYSNKVIEKIWTDDRYTIAENLKEDAQAKLEEISKPNRSYQAEIIDLARNNNEYKFLDFFLGDTITLLSKAEKFRDKQRIVKYIEYPLDPSQNTCELGNTRLTFEELQKENEAKNQVVNNITSDNGTVKGKTIDSIKSEQISDLETSVAKITNLTAINGDIVNLKAQNVNITGKLTSVEAKIGTLTANVATIDKLTVTNSASIDDLQVNKASITQLEAVNATIQVLEANVGKIETLVNGNLSSENIQAGGITSDKLTIVNGFIKNAMIDSLDVSKVNAGDISTNKFKIKSDDGGIEIVGATQQFKDKNNKVRIQMGKDAQGNFNFILRGEDGSSTLIDHTGVKQKAIADDLIVSNMISQDAVGEKQINYSSFVTGFNKDTNTNTLKATKIKLDNQNQSLEVAFNSLKTQADGIKTTTESNSTTINVMQGQINTAINNTKIVKDGQTILLKDDYNRTVSTVDSIKSTIGSHTTQINQATGKLSNVESKVNVVERNLTSITQRVSSTESNTTTLTNKVNCVEGVANSAKTTAIQAQKIANDIEIGGRNYIKNSDFSQGTLYWRYLDGIVDYQGKKCAYQTMNQTSGETFIASNRVIDEQLAGKDITLSFLSSCTPNVKSFEIFILVRKKGSTKDWDYAPNKTIELTLDLTKYTWTYSMPSDADSFYIRFDNNSSSDGQDATMYITEVKVEKGNKATDWTPAPEDVENQIDAVNSEVTKTNNKVASIETNLNGITSRVNAVETTTTKINNQVSQNKQNISTVESRLYTAESKLTKGALTTTIGNYYTTSTDVNGIVTSKGYATESQLQLTSKEWQLKLTENGGYNLLYNGDFKRQLEKWHTYGDGITYSGRLSCSNSRGVRIQGAIGETRRLRQTIEYDNSNETVTLSFYIHTSSTGDDGKTNPFRQAQIQVIYEGDINVYRSVGTQTVFDKWERVSYTLVPEKRIKSIVLDLYVRDTSKVIHFSSVMLNKGSIAKEFSPNPNETYDGIVTIDKDGIKVDSSDISAHTLVSKSGFEIVDEIKNRKIFSVKNNRTLDMVGTVTVYDNDGNKSGYLGYNSLDMYNWITGKEEVAATFATIKDNGTGAQRAGVFGKHAFTLGKIMDDGELKNIIECTATPTVHYYADIVMNGQDLNKVGNITTDGINKAKGGTTLYINQLHFRNNAVNTNYNSNNLYLNYWKGYNATTSSTTVKVCDGGNDGTYGDLKCGDFKAYGTKNCIVETDYGHLGINAYETAECYFGDIGETILDDEGYSYVYIDSIFAQTVNTIRKYQVFLTVYGEGIANVIGRHPTYFVIKGTPGIEIGYEIKAKRKGYEDNRLEREANSWVKGQEHGLDEDYKAEKETFTYEIEEKVNETNEKIFKAEDLLYSINSYKNNLLKYQEELKNNVQFYVNDQIKNKKLLNIIEESVLNESIN